MATRKRQRSNRRRVGLEQLEKKELLTADVMQTNFVEPTDVDNDGFTSPRDALMIVSGLNGSRADFETGGREVFMDVNNDGNLSPADALQVVKRLNREDAGPRREELNEITGHKPSLETHSVSDETASHRRDSDKAVAELTADPVLDWNNLFGEILINDVAGQNPGYASRSMAMLNVAIFDAVNLASGDAENTFYQYGDDVLEQGGNVSAEVAASQAAYTVLSALYPEQQSLIDSFANSSLDQDSRNHRNQSSMDVGEAIGNTILSIRANDGSDAVVDYVYSDDIGSFQADPLNPDVPVWGPGWGEVDTFAISATDDFLPQSPPEITSEEYAASYNEVLELGEIDSTIRTADQTEAGLFWAYDNTGLGTPLALYSDVLITIAQQEGNTLEENAALFAHASVSMADAAITAWDTKFTEQFWRPVTAIQQGDADGNPLTEGDTDWTALGAPDGGGDIVGFTPQFPTYISGHATFGGALFGSIREFYGTDDIAFELESEELNLLLEDPELQEAYGIELDDATRSFSSLTEAMAENGRSRVYLGIHFDFDDTVAQEVGQDIAVAIASDFAAANQSTSDEAVTDEVFATMDDLNDTEKEGRRQRRERS